MTYVNKLYKIRLIYTKKSCIPNKTIHQNSIIIRVLSDLMILTLTLIASRPPWCFMTPRVSLRSCSSVFIRSYVFVQMFRPTCYISSQSACSLAILSFVMNKHYNWFKLTLAHHVAIIWTKSDCCLFSFNKWV